MSAWLTTGFPLRQSFRVSPRTSLLELIRVEKKSRTKLGVREIHPPVSYRSGGMRYRGPERAIDIVGAKQDEGKFIVLSSLNGRQDFCLLFGRSTARLMRKLHVLKKLKEKSGKRRASPTMSKLGERTLSSSSLSLARDSTLVMHASTDRGRCNNSILTEVFWSACPAGSATRLLLLGIGLGCTVGYRE